MVPPKLPNPTCIAIPTPRFIEPPMLLLFQAIPCGTLGKRPAARRKQPKYLTEAFLTAINKTSPRPLRYCQNTSRRRWGERYVRQRTKENHEHAALLKPVSVPACADTEEACDQVWRCAHKLGGSTSVSKIT